MGRAADGNCDTRQAQQRPGPAEQAGLRRPTPAQSRRRAPSASRTAMSRRRRIERTSMRPATLKHATSRTIATARNNVRSTGRISAMKKSRSGVTSPRICMAAIWQGSWP